MAFGIFCLTMLLVFWRPFGLPLWVFSTLGAVGAYCLNVVDLGDIWRVWAMVWDSTLTLVGLILLTLLLDKLGFFNFLSLVMMNLLSAGKNAISTLRFYVFIVLFSAILSAVFANDGAILILTPLIFTLLKEDKSKHLTSPLIVFLLLVSFLSDFASNPFVISNLTNIITAQFFNFSPLYFSAMMLLPQIFILLCFGIFWLYLRRILPRFIEFKSLENNISRFGIVFCLGLVCLLLFGILFSHSLGLPLSSFTLLCAFLAFCYGILIKRVQFADLKRAPFGIVLFSLGLFIVVFGLKNGGILQILSDKLPYFIELPQSLQILSMGFASGIGSSVMNNLPMVMLGNLTIADFAPHLDSLESLVMAHLLGCNIGSKLTPIGSLATLLWLESLKIHGIHIGFMRYMAVAFVVTLPVLFFGLCGLIVGSI
ncbi:arsenic transporter [Helicobacter japonicus]|uniref:arsenic transporter n=1 Tax=Helicobacter japonicus TaxID=425400 RepID=UPI0023F11774|nr:arsenic transporter [Helicobacter japonicus]